MTQVVGFGKDLEEWSDRQKPWVEYLTKYQQLLADHSQAEILLKLGLGSYRNKGHSGPPHNSLQRPLGVFS